MKRLAIAALGVAAVFVVAGSALAAGGTRASVIFDSTSPNGPATNQPSYGPEAYAFESIGDEITFAGTARSLSSVTVTLSSWACQQGTWNGQDCFTPSGATFSHAITLTIWDANDPATPLVTSTQTFDVPYRPSASSKCTGTDAGKWYASALKTCKNGITDDVTFNFSNETLPDTLVYAISYNTNHYGPNPLLVAGPYDSLNVAIADGEPTVGVSTGDNFANATPAVQFKAGNGS